MRFIYDHLEYSRVTGLAVENSKVQLAKKQPKMQKLRAVTNEKSCTAGMETMLKAWGPFQNCGDHAKDVETMP